MKEDSPAADLGNLLRDAAQRIGAINRGSEPGAPPAPADRERARVFYRRGLVLCRRRRCRRALASYDAALALDPGQARYYLARAMAYRLLADDRAALADYSRALELAPGDADAWYLRGGLHFSRGDFPRAGADLRQAAALGHALDERVRAFLNL